MGLKIELLKTAKIASLPNAALAVFGAPPMLSNSLILGVPVAIEKLYFQARYKNGSEKVVNLRALLL